jgi:hypothetical protein
VSALRAFHRPRVWLGLWCFGWLLCVVLSLITPPQLGVDVPEGDKIGHLLAYGLLSAWAAWLFATARARVLACLGLLALGVVMELAQGLLTSDRMMDGRDAWADALGVLLGQLAALGPARGWLQRIDTRLFAR